MPRRKEKEIGIGSVAITGWAARKLSQEVKMKFKTHPPGYAYKEDGEPFTFGSGAGGKGYDIRLFGHWNYGYPDATQTYVSSLVALLTGFGAFSINKTQGIGLILGSLLTQEYILGPRIPKGQGSSWCWSVWLGYNLYHYLLKRDNSTPVWLGSWAGSGVSAFIVGYEVYLKEALVAHEYHVGGQQIGFIVAAILDAMFGSGKTTFKITPRFLTLLGTILPMIKGQYNATQLQKKIKAIVTAHPHISQADVLVKLGEKDEV